MYTANFLAPCLETLLALEPCVCRDISVGVGDFPVRSRKVFWAGAVVLTIVACGFTLVVVNRRLLVRTLSHGLDEVQGRRKKRSVKRGTGASADESKPLTGASGSV